MGSENPGDLGKLGDMSAFRVTTFIVLLLGLPLACDDPARPESTSVGLYELIGFEGVAVPGVLVEAEEAAVEILSGEFLIKSDGTCSSLWRFRVSAGDEVTDSDVQWEWGWTEDGDGLSFNRSGQPMGVGSVMGDLLTVTQFADVMCVTTPCPSQTTATYRRVAGA